MTRLDLFRVKFDYAKALQLAQTAMEINPDDVITKANVMECQIKAGTSKQWGDLALQVLIGHQGVVYERMMKFLILSSYLLEEYTANADMEFTKSFDYYGHLNEDFKIIKGRLLFRGLINAISNNIATSKTKFLLLSIIDLLRGNRNRGQLSFFNDHQKKDSRS